MNLKKTGILLATLTFLGACEGTNIFGGGNAGQTPDRAIEESSLEYFNTQIGDTVLFVVNQDTLTDEAKAILDAQVAWLNRYPERMVVIEGHADERGTREYNVSLSNRRAVAVKLYLISQGLAENRITSVIPYGKERPLRACSTEVCWSENRRAVTVVAGGMGNV